MKKELIMFLIMSFVLVGCDGVDLSQNFTFTGEFVRSSDVADELLTNLRNKDIPSGYSVSYGYRILDEVIETGQYSYDVVQEDITTFDGSTQRHASLIGEGKFMCEESYEYGPKYTCVCSYAGASSDCEHFGDYKRIHLDDVLLLSDVYRQLRSEAHNWQTVTRRGDCFYMTALSEKIYVCFRGGSISSYSRVTDDFSEVWKISLID